MWRFLGVWAKNCEQWTVSLLAAMHYKITCTGFFEAMSSDQVDFIINQTEMTSIVCSPIYAQKLVDMKKKGMVASVSALIITRETKAEPLTEALITEAK